MEQQLVAGDVLVGSAQRRGESRTGGGDRRCSAGLEDARRADVPGVGDDERAAGVQVSEIVAKGHAAELTNAVGQWAGAADGPADRLPAAFPWERLPAPRHFRC